MEQSKHVRAKIVIGYIIIIAVCVTAIGYVYREVARVSSPDDSRTQLQIRRSMVSQTLYHLYQAESYGQMMIAGYVSYENRYRKELRKVRGYIDSMLRLTSVSDTRQRTRLESISSLIAAKEKGAMSLRRSIRSGGTANLLSKHIEELTSRDSVTGKIRAADIIPGQDSHNADLADTIAGVLHSLEDRITAERLEIYGKAWEEGNKLQYNNQVVNQKIYLLIMDFEEEETAYIMAGLESQAAMKQQSTFVLGGIALTAILLTLIFVLILLRDINRSNRYKSELEKANREKEALLEAREKLMLAITHDIKAPLGSIMGYIDLLSRLTHDKRQELYLHNMKNSSEHLLALVKDLLDFHRLEANKTEVACVAFNPGRLFAEICDCFRPVAAEKGLAMKCNISSSADTEVAGDPVHIRQIADNLLSNAVKFTDTGEVTLTVEMYSGVVQFSVSDTGRGISDEEKEKVFREFVRLRSAQGVGGFGLGLSIVDRLVRLLDGTISLDSRQGSGSTFTVNIPTSEVYTDTATETVGTKHESVAGCISHCLLIDDDPIQLEMTSEMCRSLGIEAQTCQYPEYAAKLVAEQQYDFVLTDIQMPAMDGFGVLVSIRGIAGGDIPVIAVSARSDNNDADYTSQGFTTVLRKPFTITELARAVDAAYPERRYVNTAARTAQSSQAEGFDALTAFAHDDRSAATEILRSFIDQTAHNRVVISEAIEHGDMATIRAMAHKMLPIFTMIGADIVTVTLKRLERHEGSITEELRREITAMLENISDIEIQAQKKVSLQ